MCECACVRGEHVTCATCMLTVVGGAEALQERGDKDGTANACVR